MPITRIAFHIIAVGQGNGTIIVFYDDTKTGNDRIINTAIMDFGSEASTIKANGNVAVGWATTLLNAMGTRKRIGTVCFSHSDFDHVSLMARLLQKFPNGRADLKVGPVFYGGVYSHYTKNHVNVLDTLTNYTKNNDLGAGLPVAGTSFSDTTATPLITVEGLVFYSLVANTVRAGVQVGQKRPKTSRTTEFAKNTDSFVIIAETDGDQFVMNGDATGSTLVYANKILAANSAARDHVGSVIHTTVPHHGSFPTASCVRWFPKNNWEDVWTTYTDYLKAQTASVTSGVENKFFHPDAYILQFFWRKSLEQGIYEDPALENGRHYMTAYFDGWTPIGEAPDEFPDDVTVQSWMTVQTRYAMFTNDYYDGKKANKVVPPLPVVNLKVVAPSPVPASEVHWVLELTKTDYSIKPMTAIADVEALGRAINAELPPEQHPPIPDWFDALERASAGAGPPLTFPRARSGSPS